ncbi:MAG: aspartate aminotransferase family protein [Spirochaetia bacterium]|nr:aspartate aminotransferase family protein [Spirochaetia bacterium]
MSDFQEPMKFSEIQEKSDKYILNTYKRAPLAFYFGQGEYLFDTENKRYIDFLSGISVTALGHGEADIIEAIRLQADRVLHTSNLFYSQEQAQLAEALIGYSFPGKVFFCNSGTEANEAAFKLARRFGEEKKNAFQMLSLEQSFHGRTFAAMTLTGQEKIHKGFGPLVEGVKYLPPNDEDALERAITENAGEICALFLELVQGEGGVRPLNKSYVKHARSLTLEHKILLVVDEIQTGIGRTGTMFAFEQYDIRPDVMTLAKALGSGFPIGAMIVADEYADVLVPRMHGSTFGGNHLGAAVAYETLRVIAGREILSNVNAVSEFIFRRLRSMAATLGIIKDVRGLGLHIGIELDRAAGPIVESCRDKGLLINATADTVIRLLPPLNISLETTATALDILEAELRALR